MSVFAGGPEPVAQRGNYYWAHQKGATTARLRRDLQSLRAEQDRADAARLLGVRGQSDQDSAALRYAVRHDSSRRVRRVARAALGAIEARRIARQLHAKVPPKTKSHGSPSVGVTRPPNKTLKNTRSPQRRYNVSRSRGAWKKLKKKKEKEKP